MKSMSHFNEEEVRKYLSLYMDRVPISTICKGKGAPSRPTFYRWKSEGWLTNGEDWADYRDRLEREKAVEVREREIARRAEGDDAFMSRVQGDIQTMYDRVVDAVLDGRVELQVSDAERLIRLYANLDSRQSELQSWKEQFAAWVFSTALEVMTEQQFATFQMKVHEKMLSDQEARRDRGEILIQNAR